VDRFEFLMFAKRWASLQGMGVVSRGIPLIGPPWISSWSPHAAFTDSARPAGSIPDDGPASPGSAAC
jgi:hypothetical protein